MLTEFRDALEDARITYGDTGSSENGMGFFGKIKNIFVGNKAGRILPEKITIITGLLPKDYIKKMAEEVTEAFPVKDINVMPITNRFFGEKITVTGLLTGQDIIDQCNEFREAGGDIGTRLLIHENMLRSGTDVLLDDTTVGDIADALQVHVDIVKSSGYDVLECMLNAQR
jgi:NifB/MoaA-like Fe-S oxidoreductase